MCIRDRGYPFLKQAIQGYDASRGTQLAEDEIFISDGAKSEDVYKRQV